MTIREIIQRVKFSDVEKAIKYYYPLDKNKYKPVFNCLKNVKNKKHKDSKEIIEIVIGGRLYAEADWGEFYVVHTNKYSLSFRKWAEVANITISEKTLDSFKYAEIVAHVIWEITYYGTEKDAQKIAKEMNT